MRGVAARARGPNRVEKDTPRDAAANPSVRGCVDNRGSLRRSVARAQRSLHEMSPPTESPRSSVPTGPAWNRRIALLLGLLLAVAAGWGGWSLLQRPASPGFDRGAIAELLERRSRENPAQKTESTSSMGRPEDRRWYVPPDEAAVVFEVLTRINQYDPWCYYAHRPNLRHEVEWPEHPRGRWTFRTNGLGLRADVELRDARPALRILLTGDSHTSGFCDYADSFAGRVESALASSGSAGSVEVLNAADIAYSFYNYLGVLEKHRELAPTAFVVTVHGGNDFREALLPYRYFARLPLPTWDRGDRAPEGHAGDIFVPASHQGLLSVARFRDHRSEEDLARKAAVEVFMEIRAICRARNIRLVCVYLPSPIEIERERLADLVEPTMRALDLDDDDLAAHARMCVSILADIAALGVEVADTTAALRASSEACFWRTDLHLNLLGHEIVARELESVLTRSVGRVESR